MATTQTLSNPLTLSPSRNNAPLQTPADVVPFLASFGLDVPSMLTVANPKLAKTIGARNVGSLCATGAGFGARN
jgi:hypothetical protein